MALNKPVEAAAQFVRETSAIATSFRDHGGEGAEEVCRKQDNRGGRDEEGPVAVVLKESFTSAGQV